MFIKPELASSSELKWVFCIWKSLRVSLSAADTHFCMQIYCSIAREMHQSDWIIRGVCEEIMNEALLYTKDKTSLCTYLYWSWGYSIILCPWNRNFCESLRVVQWLEVVYDLTGMCFISKGSWWHFIINVNCMLGCVIIPLELLWGSREKLQVQEVKTSTSEESSPESLLKTLSSKRIVPLEMLNSVQSR